MNEDQLRDIAWIVATEAPATRQDYSKASRILAYFGKELRLFEAFEKWRDEIGISCGEAVYDKDQVLISAPEMIIKLCEIAGYTPPKKE